MTANRQTLPQISRKIAALEKNTVANVIEIGRLLDQAREQCEHGEFTAWLSREFSWSYRTSLRYRYAFSLAQKCHTVTFEKLNISISALHVAADVYTPDKAKKAIIKAALKGRVTYSIAKAIIAKHSPRPWAPPIVIAPELPPIEPLDDESPPPDEPPPIDPDDEPPSELATALGIVLRYSERNEAWPKAVKAIGAINLQGLIEALKSVYDTHCGKDAVKSKADRAEAQAARALW
jgi:Protein of unknown function (DUF3102)